MPTMSPGGKWLHRDKCGGSFGLNGRATVARSVKPKELKLNKKAMAVIEKEWSALREVGAWDEKKVREQLAEVVACKAGLKVAPPISHHGFVGGLYALLLPRENGSR